MKHWIIVVISLLVFVAQPSQAGSNRYHHQGQGQNHDQHSSQHQKIEVTIVDEYGYRLPLYDTNGNFQLKKSYMQALQQQEYSIEVRNKTSRRVGFVVAVDGRNIITGKPSYLKSREKMYILNPHQVSTFRGWRSSGNTVNRFYFTDESQSYSAAFNDYSAMGVIAVAAFFEKQPKHPPHNISNRSKNRKPDYSVSKRSSKSATAGTGWGDSEHSPTTRVKFVAQKRPFTKHLIKYEWHERLCEMGIIHCHNSNRYSNKSSHKGSNSSDSRSNRLWDANNDYAPPPPRRTRVKIGY
ncbi:MAG: hypothetical protein MJK04_32895 [Psychrosphaera sp.]|nr:hypothetical protein [Psychrosphaera sp.]